MRKIRCYLPNVILTFLLVFALVGCQAALFAKTQVLNTKNFETIAREEALADKAYTTLESYFRTRANSTGIPESVYMDVMDKEALHEAILSSVAQAFDYLNGKTDDYRFTMDFTALESSVRTFFETYADENGYEKDQVFEEKILSVTQEAESEILFVADAFKFSAIDENGLMEPARKLVAYLNLGTTALLIGTAVLLLLMLLCNWKQPRHLLYWIGLAGLISAVLLMVPCLYVTTTDYFSAFAIKDPLIFSAVVGYLKLLTGRLLIAGTAVLVGSVLCLAAFGVLGLFRKTAAAGNPPDEK